MKPVTPVSDPAASTTVVTQDSEKSVSHPEASANTEIQFVKKDDSAVV